MLTEHGATDRQRAALDAHAANGEIFQQALLWGDKYGCPLCGSLYRFRQTFPLFLTQNLLADSRYGVEHGRYGPIEEVLPGRCGSITTQHLVLCPIKHSFPSVFTGQTKTNTTSLARTRHGELRFLRHLGAKPITKASFARVTYKRTPLDFGHEGNSSVDFGVYTLVEPFANFRVGTKRHCWRRYTFFVNGEKITPNLLG